MKKLLLLILTICAGIQGYAQDASAPFQGEIPLSDMSQFKASAGNWQIAGEVVADLKKNEALKTSPGTGILVNLPDKNNKSNIFSAMEHGDMDLELEFMMAKHSNSGIYLQGRYEVQLLDSWGVKYPRFGDVAGIYQRSVDGKGVEGYAPRVNVARAPGLWQKMKIEFQAPRFDRDGNKTENAKIIRIVLNDVVVHENLELTGPTAGQAFPDEAAKAPFMIQGDHGPVAFRNISYILYEPGGVQLKNLSWEVFTDMPNNEQDLSKFRPARKGTMDQLTQEVAGENEKFVLRIRGTLPITRPGEYNFLLVAERFGALKIGNSQILPYGWRTRNASIKLEPGDHPIEVIYHKWEPWYDNALGLYISGSGIRTQALHSVGSLPVSNPVNPIPIEFGNAPKATRCFIDYREGEEDARRIVHAISVGYPQGVSFTFDPDRGALVQVWKGGYLDATPMYNSRGNGSSRPVGSVLPLGDDVDFAQLLQDGRAWPEEYDGKESLPYHFKGYAMNPGEGPVFEYTLGNAMVSDRISPAEEGKYLSRHIKIGDGIASPFHLKLAEGANIEELPGGLFAIDKTYYIRMEEKQPKPTMRNSGGKQELLLPVSLQGKSGEVHYSIIW